ncbi:MAG: cell envelope integrity protein TolA, partial [Lachnospiraceae bacterium]
MASFYNNNSNMSSESEQRLAKLKAAEEQRARFRAEEEAKIAEERRVQGKKMDQTEAMIAAIKAQVEKEKAAKEEAARQAELRSASSNKTKTSSSDGKPKFRTISPEEMAKLEEKRRLKNAGINPDNQNNTEKNVVGKTVGQSSSNGPIEGITGGVSGGLSGGPSLSNLSGGGPTLSNPNAGQQTLNSSAGVSGGLGIDITAVTPKNEEKAEERTIALDTDAINAAAENVKKPEETVKETVKENDSFVKPVQTSHPVNKPHTPSPVVGASDTVVVVGGSGWEESEEDDAPSWVETNVHAQKVSSPVKEEKPKDSSEETISVVPVRKRPVEDNDVHSAYNIDFDDDDDDDDIAAFTTAGNSGAEEARRRAEEEARRKAEEEAARKAEEEARRKAEEEARRKAEEEARRKAEEEARRKAEEEARRKAEEEARRKAEEEAARKAEEEARRKAEEEARRR